jgi:hypothetical protein
VKREVAEEETVQERMAQEELVGEKLDDKSNRWRKVCFRGKGRISETG